jgi:hypothetical protein
VVGAEPPRNLDHLSRNIQMERRALPAKGDPFGQRFEMVHRFDRLHFDDGGHFLASILGRQHDVGKDRRGTRTDRDILFGAGVDRGIETTAKPGLEKADDPVMLQLLADRPYEDGAHEIATITWIAAYFPLS